MGPAIVYIATSLASHTCTEEQPAAGLFIILSVQCDTALVCNTPVKWGAGNRR